jgi:hypothetical protein
MKKLLRIISGIKYSKNKNRKFFMNTKIKKKIIDIKIIEIIEHKKNRLNSQLNISFLFELFLIVGKNKLLTK